MHISSLSTFYRLENDMILCTCVLVCVYDCTCYPYHVLPLVHMIHMMSCGTLCALVLFVTCCMCCTQSTLESSKINHPGQNLLVWYCWFPAQQDDVHCMQQFKKMTGSRRVIAILINVHECRRIHHPYCLLSCVFLGKLPSPPWHPGVVWSVVVFAHWAGVFADMDNAWTGPSNSSFKVVLTKRCLAINFWLSNKEETTVTLKWVSEPVGTLCL